MRQLWSRTQGSVRATDTSTPRHCRQLVGMLLAAAYCVGGATGSLAQDGKAAFEAKCAVCHNIGGGPKVGPDLQGVVARRGKDGTVATVMDPAKAGLKPSMPNLGLPRKEVEAIIAHLDQAQGAAGAAAASKESAAPAAEAAAQPDEIQRGRDLFEGKVRFAGGGPSCNACHHVAGDAPLGGGVLATELTLVFSRMGKQGLQTILASSPFPVMGAAYQGKNFSEKEISALVAFLQQVEKDHARQMPREYGWRMASAGAGGVIVLLGIFSLAGRRRKNRCVNQDIYDRQTRSE